MQVYKSPIDDMTSKIYEEEERYIIKKPANDIIKYNCEFYGSSYLGRCAGTKYMTGIKTKFPIIIEESRNIIFFPTCSSRTGQSTWIALNQIKYYYKQHKNLGQILFKNNTKIDLNISYHSLENQICRASILKTKLYERKLEDK